MVGRKKEVNLWFDQGTHFRCNKVVCAAGHRWPQLLRKHFDVRFGPPAHMKNSCDQVFAILNNILRKASLQRIISEISEVVEEYTNGMANRCEPDAEFCAIDFMPKPKAEYKLRAFKVNSLPALIRSTYHYHFQISDFRRRNFAVANGEVTGIFASTKLVPGSEGLLHPDRRHPVLAAEDAEEEPEEEDVALGAGAKASEVPVMSRIVNGWRCSYRQVEDPIRPNAVAVDRRLERLSKALTPIRHRWAKSARKAPPLSAAAKLKAKTNKATKAKAASKLLRDLRTAA